MLTSYSGKRRSFFKYFLLFMASAFALLLTWGTARFVLFRASRKKLREVPEAVLAKLQPGLPLHVPEAGVWLIKPAEGGGFVALDDRCTHLGCRAKWNGDRRVFECPCHGSEYDADGKLVRGPATRSLAPLAVIKDSQGRIRLHEKQPTGSSAS